ncbi:hypothetical protein Vadar_029104 [Vaccinium darrowii]|uniref:Uncharacterized protein n=1 Tax=Vaccinium darrowii TaxID=229202 RepID=A0ACB7Y2I7_9ERIC|nr:hypothetical protein Vadar_029104 [Vaccinium darrowii]
MKEKNFRPSFLIFASLVDSMGEASRLDTSMKLYMEMQGLGLRPSAIMFVSLIELFAKAGKLETALRIWDEMKKEGFSPNYGLYTMIVESHAKSGKLEIAMNQLEAGPNSFASGFRPPLHPEFDLLGADEALLGVNSSFFSTGWAFFSIFICRGGFGMASSMTLSFG